MRSLRHFLALCLVFILAAPAFAGDRFGPRRANLGKSSAAVVIIPDVVMPGGVTPFAFYGTEHLSTYSATGPALDIVRVSDSATKTISFKNGTIDTSWQAFCSGTTCTWTKLYDQGGSNLNCTAVSNQPNLNPANVVNGIQALGFDGSNGSPIITRQCTLPSGVALDITNFSTAFVGRQTASGGTDSSIVAQSITGATAANWRVFQGPSLVATSTQTSSTYVPTNPISQILTRGATNGTKHYVAERSFARAATTGSGTSAGGLIGNTTGGAERGFFEVVALVLFNFELSTANAQAVQAALEAPFPTAIQRTFTDTIVIEGDSIALGTGTTLNQNSTRQIWPLVKRPTRMINAGVFGATINSIVGTGSAHFNIFTGWGQTNLDYALQGSSNDFANASTNQGLTGLPTIAVGGTAYANNSTFNVTTAGGTGTQAVVSVTTNGSGVVTTVNSISVFGSWSVNPTTPNTVTGGTGAGLTLNLSFAQINSFASVKANAQQVIANARTAGMTKIGIVTCLPRSTWIGTPAPWVQAQAYNADVQANYNVSRASGGYGADFIVDVASDPTMGNISNTTNVALYTDGLHPSSAGWVILAPYYSNALNAALP